MSLAERSLNRRQHPVKRCGLCGRPVRANAKRVPLFGDVGDECYHRVAALGKFLQKADLTEFADGPVTVPAVIGTDGEGRDALMVPQGLLAARARAQRIGLSLRLEKVSDDPPVIKATLKVPDVIGAKERVLGGIARLERAQIQLAAV